MGRVGIGAIDGGDVEIGIRGGERVGIWSICESKVEIGTSDEGGVVIETKGKGRVGLGD